MTKAQERKQQQETALEVLRAALPIGSTVYTVLRHVSQSGMRREITAHYVADGEVRWINVGTALGYRLGSHNGWVLNGTGMDMGFDLVYNLSRALHGDGYALSHRWL